MRICKPNSLLPRTIYSEHTDGKYADEGIRALAKHLPYVDPDTAMKNRMILSDPLTGLGDLSGEWDPLNGCQITRKALPQRDLIRMDGDRGQEYNCLYTTKELRCKPREERDPITLKGDFGEELDILRPHGGRPLNRSDQATVKRDPIVGTGEFGREWDPIYKYDGRPRRNYYIPAPTDPITHSCPEENGSRIYRSMRQYNERWINRDPILHTDAPSTSSSGSQPRQMRHFSEVRRSVNPITHLPCSIGVSSDLNNNAANGNLMEKQSHAVRTAGLNNEFLRTGSVRARGKYNPDRVYRNPITGEGMKPEDYLDVLWLPRDYHFRGTRPQAAAGNNQKQSKPEKSVRSPSRPTQSTRQQASTLKKPLEKRAQSAQKCISQDTEKPVVKKVTRPKRPPEMEQRATEPKPVTTETLDAVPAESFVQGPSETSDVTAGELTPVEYSESQSNRDEADEIGNSVNEPPQPLINHEQEADHELTDAPTETSTIHEEVFEPSPSEF
ncbi:hypothetical protein EG68_00658 [Paragonimus skrjabini miyazakii]|uniref:Uncharacterized protein n=1 Tax=Paragonimus skrjabini miyazakii TaxID=59628 RepID=A0A8S9Z9C9_9TREM|nr:hypothetical protein EG68_00658 [Paragonimus skrjabini miyazakii]